MRKSEARTGPRLIRAGIATAAAAAVVVAGTGTPAFADDKAFAFTPTTAPIGAATELTTSTVTGLMSGISSPGARVVASTATCATTYGTTSATNLAVPADDSSADVATITVPAELALGTYKVCLYAGTTPTSAIAGHSTSTLTIAAAQPALSQIAGPIGGGNQITLNASGFLTKATAIGATFGTATCPATYTTASPNIVVSSPTRTSADVATLTVPATLAENSSYNVCIYNGITAGTSALIGKSGSTYSVKPAVTLSPQQGPSGGTNNITVSSTSAILSGVTSPGVLFSRLACPATYGTASGILAGGSPQKITNYKVVVQVPTGVALTDSTEATAKYNVCLYTNTSTGPLVAAPGTYTIAPVLTVTGVSPAAGPAQGGSEVTITGAGFPEAADALVTASIGGSELEHVRVIDENTLTGTTTSHAPGTANVSVTTAAGTKSTTNSPYTYTYGITVSPNTAPNTAATVYLDVLGAGFSGMTFGSTGHTTGAHVFLVTNAGYDPAATSTNWTNPPVTECTSVLKISDNEIICTLNLTQRSTAAGPLTTGGGNNVPNGTYTVAVVSDGTPGASLVAGTDVSIISSGSTFTVAPY
jgi:hypothetical protein